MLAFHFTSSEHALDDLVRRRLKISLIGDLNDPFELLGPDLRDKESRAILASTRETLMRRYGILCFSRSWHGPVMWSHYADKHRGICLGFEIPDENAGRVRYDAKRLVDVISQIKSGTQEAKEALMNRLLFTKYEEWRYEKEARIYAALKDKDPATGHYFADFNGDMVLKTVIFGPRFSSAEAPFMSAVASLKSDIEVIWSRLAFESYSVVPIKGRRIVV